VRVTLWDGRGQRTLVDENWPLLIGGPDSGVLIPGQPAGSNPVALLAIEGGSLFIQAIDGAARAPSVNGAGLEASRWLQDGDVIMIEGVSLDISLREGHWAIVVRGTENEPGATGLGASQRSDPLQQQSAEGERIVPAAYRPKRGRSRSESRSRRPWLWPVSVLVLAGLALVAVIVLSARAITVETSPPADWMTLKGRWPTVRFGDEFLVLPGSYQLVAGRTNYHELLMQVEVGRGHEKIVRGELTPLPGRLSVRTAGIVGAVVLLDGVHVGKTPVTGVEVTLGEHSVEVLADRHQTFAAEFEIVDPAQQLDIDAALVEAWAPLTITSRPSGASISLDGQTVGLTPATVEAGAGSRLLSLSRDGYLGHQRRVTVVAGKPAGIDIILQRPPAVVSLRTTPSGATITVDGGFRGVSPIELQVGPGIEHEIRAVLAGHEASARRVTVQAGERQDLSLELTARRGWIELVDLPQRAVVTVDGTPMDAADGKLDLLAVPHILEVTGPQGESFRAEVLPKPGVTQTVRIPQPVVASPEPPAEEVVMPYDANMRLVRPGRFTMGAPRREPGRKANEVLREVEITRPYYLGVREVSNREYREFNSAHLSGKIGASNLEIDHHPVVRVTWSDAALYCNWLSERQGLDPVYAEANGRMIARSPLPSGFRLPTEAEWAWAARHPGGGEAQKYGWVGGLPIPAGAGNFGDAAAKVLLGDAIAGYSDGVVATAPSGSFNPNAVGVYNLAGNVAEWVHDVYEVRMPSMGVVEKDPVGPAKGEYHVIRGASYMSDRVTELRLTFRDSGKDRRPDLGFRIARFAD